MRIAIAGAGNVGRAIARELLENGHHVLLIDKDPKALANRSEIAFSYRKAGAAKSDNRRVNPLGLSAWKGEWYLVGEDLDRSDIRTFNLSRIISIPHHLLQSNKQESSKVLPTRDNWETVIAQ